MRIETNLYQLERDVGSWAEEQFGEDQPASFPLIGAGEEIGELSRSILKRAQGIEDSEKYAERDDIGDEAEMDSIGDVMIYLADFCNRSAIDMADGFDLIDDDFGFDTESSVSLVEELFAEFGEICRVYREIESRSLLTNHQIVRNAEYQIGRVIATLVEVADNRGYDFDECVQIAIEDVLDREWDSSIDLEA